MGAGGSGALEVVAGEAEQDGGGGGGWGAHGCRWDGASVRVMVAWVQVATQSRGLGHQAKASGTTRLPTTGQQAQPNRKRVVRRDDGDCMY